MAGKYLILMLILLEGIFIPSHPQCYLIGDNGSQQRTNGSCAPVELEMDVNYNLKLPVDPSRVEILYEWNDGTGATTTLPGNFIGNDSVWGSATHVYPTSGSCTYTAEAFLVIDGTPCRSSGDQSQTIISWARDNENGGELTTNPVVAEFCEGDPIYQVFDDATTFNCDTAMEPDVPNLMRRWVQFIYGTQATGGNRIPTVDIDTGSATINMTDGSGNSLGIHEGPIIMVPEPAFGPNQSSYPIIAPPGGVAGDIFEITIRNWNTCNPYDNDVTDGLPPSDTDNGDNPPITQIALVKIIDTPPSPGNPVSEHCAGSSIDLSTSGTSVSWYSDSLLNNLVDTGSTLDPTQPPLNIDNTVAGNFTVYVTDTYGKCESAPTKVEVEIYDMPYPNPNAGNNDSVCGVNATLNGNTPVIGTGEWTSNGGATILDPTNPSTAVLDLDPGENTFYWTFTNGPCVSVDSVKVYSDLQPDPAIVGGDQSFCNTSTTTISANTPNHSGIGKWTFASGNGSFANDDNPHTQVSNLQQGVNKVVWEITSLYGKCNTTTDTLAITRDVSPAPANAGPDVNVCDTANVLLNANAPNNGGSGLWQVLSGTANFTDSTLHGTEVSGLSFGDNHLKWTIYSSEGICSPTMDTVTLTRYPSPDPATTGGDQSFCSSWISNPLGGNTPSAGTGSWSVTESPAGATYQFNPSPLDENSTFEILNGTAGIFKLAWTIQNGVCNTSDTLTIDFAVPPSPADAGPDKDICGLAVTLEAMPPDTGIGTWRKVSGPGNVQFIPDDNDPNAIAKIDNGFEGTYVLEWKIENGICPVEGRNIDSMNIRFRLLPDPPAVTDNKRCGTGNITLNTSLGSGGNVNRWYLHSSGGSPVHTGLSYSLAGISKDTIYYVSTYNDTSACESGRMSINARVYPIPGLPDPYHGRRCGEGQVTLNATPGTNANTIRWYGNTTGGSIINENLNFQTPDLTSSTSYWISSYNDSTQCEGNREEIMATIYPVPGIPGVADAEKCGPDTFELHAVPGDYTTTVRWYDAPTGGNLIHSDDIYTTSPLLNTTSFWVTGYNDTTLCESSRQELTAFVYTIPQPPVVSDVSSCGPDTLYFSSVPGGYANTSRWYPDVASGILIEESNSFSSFIDSNRYYYVSSYNDTTGCESTREQVEAEILPLPGTSPISGASIVAINQSNVIYSVENHTGSSYVWNIPTEINNLITNKNISLLEFPTLGLHTISLYEIADNGCPGDLVTKDILVKNEFLNVEILTAGDKGCTGRKFHLSAEPAGGTPDYTFSWTGNTGPLSDASIANPYFETSTPGNYYLKVTVTDINGKQASDSLLLSIYESPLTWIDQLETTICGTDELLLETTTSGGSGIYPIHVWYGETQYLDDPLNDHVVFSSLVPGTYQYIYRVSDSNGCYAQDSTTINVKLPAVSFVSDAQPACSPLEVRFTNTTENAVNYNWDFGDGENDTDPQPVHVFKNHTNAIQYYNVQLTATDSFGCEYDFAEYVTVYPNPENIIKIEPDTGCSPVISLLNGNPGGFRYEWDFGDGTTLTGGYNVLHQFENNSTGDTTYRVRLVAESFFSCLDTAFANIVVHPSPVAHFEATPESQMFPESTVFIRNLTGDGNWHYNWDFGDGKLSEKQHPASHKYIDKGNYKISLRVNDDHCADSMIKSIEILPHPPIAEFDPVDPGCMPLTVHFQNKSAYTDTYLWEFGDGSVSNKPNPTYTYYEAGKYKIKLTVTGEGGIDYKSQETEVYVLPNSFFDFAPKFVYVNDESVNFFNLSDHGDIFEWDFGDGTTSSKYNPKHLYREEGVYDVTLKVWTSDDCFDLYELQNAVIVKPTGKVEYPNVFSPLSQIEENREFYPGIIDNVLDYHLMIFNRWGELIFESFDQDIGWDGRYLGKPAKQDVYVWKVEGKYTDGQTFIKMGDVTLLY